MSNDRAKIKRGQCPACGSHGFALNDETQRIECLSCCRQYRLYTEGPGGRLLDAYHLKTREPLVPTGLWDGYAGRPRGAHSHRRSSDAV